MKTRIVAIPVLILFVLAVFTPLQAHRTDNPNCEQLRQAYMDAFADYFYKMGVAIRAWWAWKNAEGTWEKIKKKAALVKAGLAFRKAAKKAGKAKTHHDNHCN